MAASEHNEKEKAERAGLAPVFEKLKYHENRFLFFFLVVLKTRIATPTPKSARLGLRAWGGGEG